MARKPKTKATTVEGEYDVGYCKPPVHSQFPPGQSGCPGGRPKRKPPETDLARLVAEELQKEIDIQEGGKSRKVSKAALMATQIAAKVGRFLPQDVRQRLVRADQGFGVLRQRAGCVEAGRARRDGLAGRADHRLGA